MSKIKLKVLQEDDLRDRIGVVVGTRPGIVMFSPIVRELERQGADFFVVHTGQHYSFNMDRAFFDDLELREPDHKLETVRTCIYHGEQTAEMLKGIERVLLHEKPRCVLVGGDANTNLAGALAARKLRLAVGHVEAGERSYDWRMPEEHNRVMIDHISDVLFVTNEKGRTNLLREGIRGRIVVSGNPIVDAARQNQAIALQKSRILDKLGLHPKEYFVLTLHREENVDSRENLSDVLRAVREVAEQTGTQVQFIAHPRTLKRIGEFGLQRDVDRAGDVVQVQEAIGYLDFLKLASDARLVLTDSGGVQQEACILGVPCVTLRENTEWTETLEIGANALAGTDPQRIVETVSRMLEVERGWDVPFGDGRSSVRIVDMALEMAKAAFPQGLQYSDGRAEEAGRV